MQTVKQKIIALLAEAYELADEISVDGIALGEDASADACIAEVREAIDGAMGKVNYYADGDGC